MYLLSEVREVTSCSTSEPARSLVMRTAAARRPRHRRVQILSALIGSLHGKDGNMGWDLNEFGAGVSFPATQRRLQAVVECLCLIPMQMLGFICCY